MAFTIPYKYREAAERRPFQVLAANAIPITGKSIKVSNLKWVTASSPLLSDTVISSLLQSDKYASWAQGNAFSSHIYHQSTVPEHHWSHTISYLNLFMTSLQALFLFQPKGKLFIVRVVKPCISCGMSIFGDFWKPAAWDPEQAGLTLVSPTLSRRMDKLTPEVPSSLNYSFITWLSFFIRTVQELCLFMVVYWCTIENHTAVLQLIVKS